MQKYRSIFRPIVALLSTILMFAGLALFAAPADASGPTGTTTESERRNCQGDYDDRADYDLLGPNGAKRPGIGHVTYLVKIKKGIKRLCGFTQHGDNTYGKSLYTLVEVGTVPKGGGTQSLRFWDKGVFKKYTNGRAITPSKGRCAVIHALIEYKGKTYERWRVTGVCNTK